VEQGLSALQDRIQGINQETNARYKVTEAVAFGDFLSDRPRLQAADVGIRLVPRKSDTNETETAREHAAEEAFLKQVRGKTASLHIQPYEWMAVAAGVSVKVISDQLGHASISFTLERYSHVLPSIQDEAAARVERLLRG
jgi:integrase